MEEENWAQLYRAGEAREWTASQQERRGTNNEGLGKKKEVL